MSELAVELRGIGVRFGACVANHDVTLDARPGEVHAVVGENGAGKSTLMRALYGLAPVTAGEVYVRGERIARPSPSEAIRRGVGMVHQHFMLVDTLSVAENVVLGNEPLARGLLGRAGVIDRVRALRDTSERAAAHGLAVEPARIVDSLSVGEQQRVEILKTLYRGARILILDEPTAVLTPPEVTDLFRVLRGLRDAGGTVLLVTHKLDEVMAIADRITVLRRGEVALRLTRAEATPEIISRAMVGRDPAGAVRPRIDAETSDREVRLRIEHVSVAGEAGRARLPLDDVSLDVHAGEILGVAGVEGNGQAELIGAITGLSTAARGRVSLDGNDVTRATAGARRRLGLGYVPEDRHRRGLLLDRSVADNLLLGREHEYSRAFGLAVDRARLLDDARRLLDEFDVRPADPHATARALSGGNQQKVVLARELSRKPRILVCAQPTRGVDIGAIERIHRAIDAARAGGAATLLFSAELDELLALADRIAVLYRGRLVATLPRAECDSARLGALMTGAATVPSQDPGVAA